ncbi:hypothetical protein ACFOEZ_20405 [Tianweitania populi]|uniref:Uncharacterized protein n=1 Tax=Tianweitania populi TaxID=1607949 RepID=A0A8J3DR71_9HYPH|nr:hypothetical protein [Tianweitania populi]GHD20884.1 hypothetical protein GCM10016234_33900 [Tianweitania populi]
MSKKNTLLFGASLAAALGAITADYAASEAPPAAIAKDQTSNPCAAAPPTMPRQRSYDDLANEYSGGPAAAPAPEPAPPPDPASNPCSAGTL